MVVRNDYNNQTQQGSVAETDLADGYDNELFDGVNPRRFFRLSYYISVIDPVPLNLGTITMIIRWHDGNSLKTFSSTGLTLSTIGYTQGNVNFCLERTNQPSVPQPTFEIVQTSLLGSPGYQYNLFVEAIPHI